MNQLYSVLKVGMTNWADSILLCSKKKGEKRGKTQYGKIRSLLILGNMEFIK